VVFQKILFLLDKNQKLANIFGLSSLSRKSGKRFYMLKVILLILLLQGCSKLSGGRADLGLIVFLSKISSNSSSVNAPQALSYPSSSYSFTVGTPISTQVPNIIGVITRCAANPGLPTGLSLNSSNCEISGTPSVSQVATSHTITASNSAGSTTATIIITVNSNSPSALNYSSSAFVFTNGIAVPTITPNLNGSLTSCSSTPAFPPGLVLDQGNCAISGTPTSNQGTTTYVITASNSFGSTTASISITINIPPPSALNYAGSPFTFTNGVMIASQTPTVTGTIANCVSSPTLPTGLSLSGATCTISGVPTVDQAATPYTITASNPSGNTTANISITVFTAPP
jgi:hypothetical protein